MRGHHLELFEHLSRCFHVLNRSDLVLFVCQQYLVLNLFLIFLLLLIQLNEVKGLDLNELQIETCDEGKDVAHDTQSEVNNCVEYNLLVRQILLLIIVLDVIWG